MQNPYHGYHFQVDWGGTRIGFAEVSGLDIFVEAVDFREGSSPVDSSRKLPGLIKFNNITLKRAIVANDQEFFAWINTKRNNVIERRDGGIRVGARWIARLDVDEQCPESRAGRASPRGISEIVARVE